MRNAAIAGVVVVVIVVGAVLISMHNNTKTSSNNMGTKSASSSSTSSPGTQPKTMASGNVAITGGTNGPSCDSGGYFKPSSVTISSGETVTFSVPSDDPYSGGLQVNGLAGGAIVVPRGGSMTTSPITSTVSFYGTWPSQTACRKGSGTITVQ